MNIIVLGAGAIGSIFGAKLSRLNDVLLIARKGHADKINRNGLKVTGIESKTYKIKAATRVKKIYRGTLILLTTKVTDSQRAINSIKGMVRKDTTILCVQNGLYSENIVKRIIGGKCLVLRAVTNFGAAFLKPGAVKYNSYSYTAIEKNERSKEIAENFRKCGLNGHMSENIKHDMWKKLALNCVLNPITSILKIKNREIADERLNPLKRLVIEECAKVARKDGVNIDYSVERLNSAFKKSENISSMQQDLIKGKRTEIDYLNGAVAELGKKYGVKCPVNEALAEIVKGMEKD